MQGRPPEKLLRRQLAVRRLFLRDGVLTPDARLFIQIMKRACHARRQDRIVILGPNGVDPVATVAAAARRELFDEFVQLMNLDNYTVTNITTEED